MRVDLGLTCAKVEVSAEEFDLCGAMGTTILSQLREVVEILDFPFELVSIKPFACGNTSHHVALWSPAKELRRQ